MRKTWFSTSRRSSRGWRTSRHRNALSNRSWTQKVSGWQPQLIFRGLSPLSSSHHLIRTPSNGLAPMSSTMHRLLPRTPCHWRSAWLASARRPSWRLGSRRKRRIGMRWLDAPSNLNSWTITTIKRRRRRSTPTSTLLQVQSPTTIITTHTLLFITE